jgi:transposase
VPVNILNLSDLDVVDFRETDTEYHVRAMPKAISRLCPHCGRSNDTVVHAKRTLVIRDIPSHGKAVVIHLDVPRLKCRPCIQTFTASVPEVDTGREMATMDDEYETRIQTREVYLGVDLSTLEQAFDSGKF